MAQARKIPLSLESILTATCVNPTPSGRVTSLSRRLASVPSTLQSPSCRVASPTEPSGPSLHAGSLSEERLQLPTACRGLALEFPGSGNLGDGVPPRPAGGPPPGLVQCLFLLVSRILATGFHFVVAEGFLFFGNKCLEPWLVSSVLRPQARFGGYCLRPLVGP